MTLLSLMLLPDTEGCPSLTLQPRLLTVTTVTWWQPPSLTSSHSSVGTLRSTPLNFSLFLMMPSSSVAWGLRALLASPLCESPTSQIPARLPLSQYLGLLRCSTQGVVSEELSLIWTLLCFLRGTFHDLNVFVSFLTTDLPPAECGCHENRNLQPFSLACPHQNLGCSGWPSSICRIHGWFGKWWNASNLVKWWQAQIMQGPVVSKSRHCVCQSVLPFSFNLAPKKKSSGMKMT